MSLMVSVSGIRGIFGESLTPDVLTRFAAAFGTWAEGGKVVVGRDSRVTGEICENIVVSVLQSVGCDVVRVGISPTPTIAMAVLKHNAKGAIILSASHNPAAWNALKMLDATSEFLDAKEGQKILDIAESNQFAYKPYNEIGTVTDDPDALTYHVDKILELPYIHADVIKKANFSVAVDAVNGAGSLSIPYLLERLGVKTIEKLYCEPNGLFPHNPEPLPEHLGEICELMKSGKYSLGVVVDPDADRLALVDSNGRLFGEEYTQATAFDFYLSKKRGDICTNLSSSMICDYVADWYAVKCHRSAVGEINVVRKMQATGAVISGEGNGGVINPDLHSGRDALVGIAMVLQHLAEKNITSAEYRSSLPDYFIVKNKIEISGLDPDIVLGKLAHRFAKYNIDITDGVKITFEDGWAHLRKSNTEPIIRLYTEAKSREHAEFLAKKVMKEVR